METQIKACLKLNHSQYMVVNDITKFFSIVVHFSMSHNIIYDNGGGGGGR